MKKDKNMEVGEEYVRKEKLSMLGTPRINNFACNPGC